MEILNSKNIHLAKNCVMTMGNFDGLHFGHIEIINYINELAKSKACKSLLITFSPHPITVLKASVKNYLITSFKKKIEILNDLGLDFVYPLKFDKDFANIEADDFIKNYICNTLKPVDIVVGYDHFFGKNREGSFDLLKEYKDRFSYGLHRVEKVKKGSCAIKSSAVRSLITAGDVVEASQLLGRKFSFFGTVVSGRGEGRKMSFPTANIKPANPFQLIPKDGVYHTDLFIKKDNKKYNSVCNIGVRPTFNDCKDDRSIEVHILSDGIFDIYNHEIEIIFKSYIRDEIKFNDKKELIYQINLDKEYCVDN